MRNRRSPIAAARRAAGWLCGPICAAVVLAAGCTTVIEEQGYDGLEVGITKTEALSRLNALAETVVVHAALPRPEELRPRTRGSRSDIIRLAAASVGGGALTSADRAYLLQYDRWYFEDGDGKRSVLITFDGDGMLVQIDNRREASWLEAVF